MPQTMAEVKQELRRQWIETPSWAYGNTGTRFKVFRNPAAARDPYEKVEDAAFVHRLTGVAPSVALHIPWDRVDDYGRWRSTRPTRVAHRGYKPERVPGGRVPPGQCL